MNNVCNMWSNKERHLGCVSNAESVCSEIQLGFSEKCGAGTVVLAQQTILYPYVMFSNFGKQCKSRTSKSGFIFNP